jgi:hypothetical protein
VCVVKCPTEVLDWPNVALPLRAQRQRIWFPRTRRSVEWGSRTRRVERGERRGVDRQSARSPSIRLITSHYGWVRGPRERGPSRTRWDLTFVLLLTCKHGPCSTSLFFNKRKCYTERALDLGLAREPFRFGEYEEAGRNRMTKREREGEVTNKKSN